MSWKAYHRGISVAEIAGEEDNLNRICLMHIPLNIVLNAKIISKKQGKVRFIEDEKNKKRKY